MRTRLAWIGVCLVALAAQDAARAGGESLDDALRALDARDAERRLAAVSALGADGSARAAEVLGRVARTDDDARVRVAAAQGLAAIPSEAAELPLKELVAAGGIREVRRLAARGLGGRAGAVDWVVRRAASNATGKVERALLVSALGDFPGLDAAAALEHLVGAEPERRAADDRPADGSIALARFVAREHPPIRTVALRALARHPLGRLELPRAACGLLASARDAETILAALDACDGVLDRELEDVLPPLAASKDARVRAAAASVAKRIEWRAALERFEASREEAEKARRDGYAPFAPTEPEPVAPLPRRRVDVVHVWDATASSVRGGVHEVLGLDTAADEERDASVSFRHAFVAMQDTRREASDPPSMYFPPLFDASALRGTRWRLPASGVDTEGMAVGAVLREVLDRFEWRDGAERRVTVTSDTSIGDLALARSVVSVHRAADGLTLLCPAPANRNARRQKSWEELMRAASK